MSVIEVKAGVTDTVASAFDSSQSFVVDAGGVLDILASGSVAGDVTINGGVVDVETGASLTGAIHFGGAGWQINLFGQTTPFSVNADNGAVSLTGAQAVVSGQNDVVTLLGGGNTAISIGGNVGGLADVVNGSGATITLLDDSFVNVNGNYNAIAAGDDDTFALLGDNNSVQATSDTFSVGDVGWWGANSVFGSRNTITLLDHSTLNVNGDANTITAQGDATIRATGASETINANGAHILISGTGSDKTDTLNGDNNSVLVSANSNLSLSGDGNRVVFGLGSLASVGGSGDRLVGAGLSATVASGSRIWIGGTGDGPRDRVSASGSVVIIGGGSTVLLSGADDRVLIKADATASLFGSNLDAHAGYGSTVLVGGSGATSAANTLTGANFTVTQTDASNLALNTINADLTMGDNAAVTVQRFNNTITAGDFDTVNILAGSGNQVTLGKNDTLSDTGSGTVFTVAGDIGGATFTNFGAGQNAVVDLLNGVGGFASANDAFNALTSDGNGGFTLSLGSAGTIDFAGATLYSLSSANFKIG